VSRDNGEYRVSAPRIDLAQLDTARAESGIHDLHKTTLGRLIGAHLRRSKSFKEEGKAPIRGVKSSKLVEQFFNRPISGIVMDMLPNCPAERMIWTTKQNAQVIAENPQFTQKFIKAFRVKIQILVG
jgi:hypothetical protein